MILIRTFLILSIVILSSCVSTPLKPTHSDLWGASGEKWDRNRIPDFTQAGAFKGHIPTGNLKQINVKSFGAIGDGVTDDSIALSKAIKKCGQGAAVVFPAGVFKVSTQLKIHNNRCLLKGAGQNQTTILFEKGLEELFPRYVDGQTPWSWSGSLILFDNVKESGIEDLTIQFPDNEWQGHNFHERGYNAVGFQNKAADCWLRNVTIVGPDLGIWIGETAHNITATQWTIQFGPKRAAQKLSCHHAVNVYGNNNLLSHFRIEGVCQHDLSVESENSHHNVFSNGSGRNLSFDHHSQDYEQRNNLFTEIDIGEGTRMYASGGNRTPRGVSFNETWWNIKSVKPVQWVTSMGVSKNNVIVGVNTRLSSVLNDEHGNWFEAIPPEAIEPKNLYEAQRQLTQGKH